MNRLLTESAGTIRPPYGRPPITTTLYTSIATIATKTIPVAIRYRPKKYATTAAHAPSAAINPPVMYGATSASVSAGPRTTDPAVETDACHEASDDDEAREYADQTENNVNQRVRGETDKHGVLLPWEKVGAEFELTASRHLLLISLSACQGVSQRAARR